MYKSTYTANRLNLSFISYFIACIVLSVFYIETGLIALAIGVTALTYSAGLEIDVKNNRYRNYSKILGYNLGGWKHLPPVKYVSVVRYISVSDADSGESDSSDYQYKLILAVDDHKRVVKLTSLEKEKAIEEALKIGEMFDLKVYDCTTPEKKWIR
ncbi:hypothetical protein [Carboxylicivirga linearis]|uniref:Uncharacterized protein n=1 Tax=Carboxylicivirga linearis TaxID=1628157 RepID=A0ABS5JR87_9BACT|nr:hypothetical protein [Carboxylicivirga linearis]MBS2097352.1 hypothetical protein [Carboxylicivirga linearis]